MTKSAVGLASELCRTFVGRFLVVFLAALALGASAQAGAWEEFERRCLVPMENLLPPIARELSIDYHMSRKKYSVYWGNSNRVMMTLHYDTSNGSRNEIVICSISYLDGGPSNPQIQTSVRAGMSKMVKLGKFTDTTGSTYLNDVSASAGLRIAKTECEASIDTNQTREPVLRVCLWRHTEDNTWNVSAMETDLES